MLSFASYNVPIAQAGPRFKAYLERKFACLPVDARRQTIEKWLKIRIWHLAEKRVWRAFKTLDTSKTEAKRKGDLLKLMMAYRARNKAYGEAIEAHYRATRHTSSLLRKSWPSDVQDMMIKHPGFFPPRH